jgi:uncharacterized protein YecT (DUF1311 family)
VRIFLALLVLAIPASGFAAFQKVEEQYTQRFKACMRDGDTIADEMIVCLETEHHYQDRRLQRAYDTTMQQLPNDMKVSFRNGQRQWIKDRDIQCEAAGEKYRTQDWTTVAVTQCLVDETIYRRLVIEHTARQLDVK